MSNVEKMLRDSKFYISHNIENELVFEYIKD